MYIHKLVATDPNGISKGINRDGGNRVDTSSYKFPTLSFVLLGFPSLSLSCSFQKHFWGRHLPSAGHRVDIQACLSVRCAASSFMTSEPKISN